MDEIDIAGEHIEKALAYGIAAASKPRFTVLATGACLECEEPLAEGVRWCSGSCRDQWQSRVNRSTGGRI